MTLKKSAELKYYIYISKTKLDMLYQQIDRPHGGKHTLEWKLNAKVASVTAKKETVKAVDQNLDDRLKAVIAELDASDQVGTIDEPKAFFRGNLDMKWGMLRDTGRPEEEPPLVYFGGRTKKTIFGLGGSNTSRTWFRRSIFHIFAIIHALPCRTPFEGTGHFPNRLGCIGVLQ